MISGFILTGVLAGPYCLKIIDQGAVLELSAIDALALPFIAYAAGSELRLEQFQRSLRTIAAVIVSIVTVTLLAGVAALFFASSHTPLTAGRAAHEVVVIALLGATILCAISPSAVIAVIKELRATGPFTNTVLGVVVLMDAVVILLFAVSGSVADIAVNGGVFRLSSVAILFCELLINLCFGFFIAWVIRLVLSLSFSGALKGAIILLIGFVSFDLSRSLHEVHLFFLPVPLLSEPLLFSMLAAFIVANYTPHRDELSKIVEDLSPFVFTLFFTSLGVGLQLDVLSSAWIALISLVLARAVAMWIGGAVGTVFSGEPARIRYVLGLAFLSQAGISLGLAKEVAVEFPIWGMEFATLYVGVIVVNTLIGPLFLKAAIYLVEEARERAAVSDAEYADEAIIFGVEDQSILLAKDLCSHSWKVKLVDPDPKRIESQRQYLADSGVESHIIPGLGVEEMQSLGADKAETIVCMLSSDINFKICETAFEHFGTPNLIVRLHDGTVDLSRFRDLGAVVVDSATAMTSLLSQYVRSPSTASLFLGQEKDKASVEVVVQNRALRGIALRDLRLPNDVLVVAMRRRGQLLLTHGYNRLRLGDELTVIGKEQSLDLVKMRLADQPGLSRWLRILPRYGKKALKEQPAAQMGEDDARLAGIADQSGARTGLLTALSGQLASRFLLQKDEPEAD